MQRFIALLAICALLGPVLACNPASPTVTVSGTAKSKGFDVKGVSDHINGQLAQVKYLSNTRTSLSCVDARSDSAILGTPGGDFAEFLGAAVTYYATINQTPTMDGVRALFRAFMAAYITPPRPFYYHTDETRLKMAFTAIGNRLNPNRNITVLPVVAPPTDGGELGIWLDELSQSYAQGCGHLRLMIQNFSTYGLTSNELPRMMVKVYIDEFWRASAAEKAKFNFVVKLGTLAGAAVGVISTTGTCQGSGFSPAIRGNFLGSTIFVYHVDAVADFRRDVLATFFAKQSPAVPAGVFLTNVTNLLGKQLVATLTDLSPANEVSVYTIAVPTTGRPPAVSAASPTLAAHAAVLSVSLAAMVSWLAL